MPPTALSHKDRQHMLKETGLSATDDLFKEIPASAPAFSLLQKAISDNEIEIELRRRMPTSPVTSYLGGGVYDHYIPATVDSISSRGEFLTAYTPYQAEVSQGTLALMFEFQTYISRLTNLPVANAGMYDGATALAEAALMAVRKKKKDAIAVSRAVNPHYRNVLNTYMNAADIAVEEISLDGTSTNLESLNKDYLNQFSAVCMQSPNFFGTIEDLEEWGRRLKESDTEWIQVVTEPFSLALLKPASDFGARIICGDAQAFGNPPAFGGPLVGFIATHSSYTRSLPGRLSGMTIDSNGNRAFSLTLQTREQHIRRERATSNICTSQALVALRSALYLSFTGRELPKIALQNHENMKTLSRYCDEAGLKPIDDTPFFNERTFRLPETITYDKLQQQAIKEGLAAGIDAGRWYPEMKGSLILCTTEKHDEEDLRHFGEFLTEALKG